MASASASTARQGTRCVKTMLDEFYRVAFRKKLYHSLAGLQADLDQWLRQYNEVRTHQGRWCYGCPSGDAQRLDADADLP